MIPVIILIIKFIKFFKNFLKKTIELDKNYIEKANLDADFDNIRDSDEFKELIG